MEWGECKNVVMGDDCGCQNLELSLNDHFCVDVVIATSTSMPCQKMIFQILDHAKRNMMGNIVVAKVA
jgi:hypothetical protein